MTIPSSQVHGSNGRGIVQIGNTLYYTAPYSNWVYGYDLGSNLDLGSLFQVTAASGLASMAYDGVSLYIEDYSGTGIIYKYSPSGTLQGTVTLSNCAGVTCDGLEVANGRLIANRGDGIGPYDVYSLSGSLLTPAFITDITYGDTGIAFDGTSYYVSRVSAGQIAVFNASGVYQSTITLAGGHNVEDISVDYSSVLNPGILKICKVADLGVTVGTPFTFTVNGNTISVPAGAAPGGNCALAGNFAPNTAVTVQETATSSTAVNAITVAPPANLSGSPDLPNRKVQVTMGNGVTEVTFTNQASKRETGYLEICKQERMRGSGNFTFNISGGSPATVSVPVGGCSPAIRAYAGQVTIQEIGGSMVACSTIPASRQGACNFAAQTSTVSVVPGGISTETIAIVTNGLKREDRGRQIQGDIGGRPPSGAPGCDKIDPTKSLPPQCLCRSENGQGCAPRCQPPMAADAKTGRCLCPQGSEAKNGGCVKSGSILDDIHVGIGIGVGGGSGHTDKPCDPTTKCEGHD